MSDNKFSGFFDARKGESQQPAEPQPTPTTFVEEQPKTVLPPQQPIEGVTRGRPAIGKRSNPDYQQVSCFVRKDTYLEAQIKLRQQGKKQDFSDLVEELVATWLQK